MKYHKFMPKSALQVDSAEGSTESDEVQVAFKNNVRYFCTVRWLMIKSVIWERRETTLLRRRTLSGRKHSIFAGQENASSARILVVYASGRTMTQNLWKSLPASNARSIRPIATFQGSLLLAPKRRWMEGRLRKS